MTAVFVNSFHVNLFHSCMEDFSFSEDRNMYCWSAEADLSRSVTGEFSVPLKCHSPIIYRQQLMTIYENQHEESKQNIFMVYKVFFRLSGFLGHQFKISWGNFTCIFLL